MPIKVEFGFMAIATDEETGEEQIRFAIEGNALAKALINFGGEKKGTNFAIILPHNKPGQFNVIAASQQGEALGYSFTNIADTAQLGEHLKELGVSDKMIAVWNEQSGHAVPLANGETSREAADFLTRLSDGAKPPKKGLE